jgi:hypothetical protein
MITHAELLIDEGIYEPRIKFSGEIPLICYMYDSLPPGRTDDDVLRDIGEILMKDIRDHLKQEKPDYQTWE